MKTKVRGIYAFFSTVPGKNKVYVGQSEDIHQRITTHKKQLKDNKHYNTHLQGHYNKYGEGSLEALTVHCANYTENLTHLEKQQALYHKELGFILFNQANIADSMIATPEYRAKIGRKSVEMWRNPAYRAKQAAMWQDPEFRAIQIARMKISYKKASDNGSYDKVAMRERSIRMWEDPVFRAKQSRKGTWTEAQKDRQSEITKELLTRPGHREKLHASAIAATSKRVEVYLYGVSQGVFCSASEASRQLGLWSTAVSSWAAGSKKSGKGYTARYV